MKELFDKHCFRRAYATILTLAVMAALLQPAGCGTDWNGTGRLEVAADIVPMADFCRAVGGDMVEVELLVPPGASPHTHELTTGQMRFLAGADVVVTVGLGLTPWAEEVFAKAGNPDLEIVVAGEAVPPSSLVPAGGVATAGHADDEKEEGGDAECDAGSSDPHVWLDPELVVYMVEAIRDAFIDADPANAEAYRENAAGYAEELARLDGDIARATAELTHRGFISFHSSFTYFARRYGLEQVGVIEEQPGKEPSAGEIAELVDLIESRGVRAVFAEPQFNPRAAEAIAEESGGTVVVGILDPLGDPDDPGADTYLEVMRNNLAAMVEALR